MNIVYQKKDRVAIIASIVVFVLILAFGFGFSYTRPTKVEIVNRSSAPIINSNLSFHQQALSLLSKYPVIDGHNDVAWLIHLDMDNHLSNYSFDDASLPGTSIPKLRQGKVGGQFWAAYFGCGSQYKDAVKKFDEQVDVLKRLIKKYPKDMQLVTTPTGLEQAVQNGKIGSMLGVESGHGIDSSLAVLRSLYQLGVRYMTLTHNCNTPWAGSNTAEAAGDNDGITEFGKVVIKEMNRLGMMVDLAHVSSQTMHDVIEVSSAPVIFSHSSARALNNVTRNVPDHILKRVGETGGIVMVNFYSCFLKDDCNATIQDLIDHIEHVRKVAGVDSVGLGSDFNGVDKFPPGMGDESKYPNLFAEMIRQGRWTEEELGKLAWGNLIRVWKRVEEVRDSLVDQEPFEDIIDPSAYTDEKQTRCMSS